jgi:hypothetical protein
LTFSRPTLRFSERFTQTWHTALNRAFANAS